MNSLFSIYVVYDMAQPFIRQISPRIKREDYDSKQLASKKRREFFFHCSKDSETELKRLRRVVVTTTEKNRLIQACHDGIDGGHYGRDKTLSKVSTCTRPSCVLSLCQGRVRVAL